MSNFDDANNHPVLDQPLPPEDDPAQHPARFHFLETMDGLANVAKACNIYPDFINATLQVAAVMLSEIGEEQVDQVIGTLAAQAQAFRMQRMEHQAAQQAAAESAAEEASEAQAIQQPNEGAKPHVH